MGKTKKTARRGKTVQTDIPKTNGHHEIRIMALADLRPAAYNPRVISEESMAGLTKSIERFGLVEPIVVNRRNNTIIGGHQRVAAMQAQGKSEAQVMVVDLSDEDERALNVTLNNPHITGEWNKDMLTTLLDQIKSDETIDFDGLRLNELFNDLNLPPEGSDAATDNPNIQYVVLIQCESESKQLELIERFQNEGLSCKAFVS